MKRSLTSSEKVLLALCLTVLAVVGLLFSVRDYRARKTAAEALIAELEPQLIASEAAAADAPFWESRQVWLDSVMPSVTDAGKAHSDFLEELLESAKARGLSPAAPVLLKPETGKEAQDFSVTLQVTGPDSAVFRWLAELQSPEKLRTIKYLLLAPQSVQPPRMSGTVTIAKLFKP
jgi:hypothetical protein